MNRYPSLLLALTLALNVATGAPARAALLIDETFTGPSLTGWTESATSGTTYRYTVNNGLTFSDNTPVTGQSTSIVPPSGQRGIVTFTKALPNAVSDFEAVLSFSWNNNVGTTPSGATAAVNASPILYFDLYNSSSLVAFGGLYDNWRVSLGSPYASITGQSPTPVVADSLPAASGGIHTLTLRREGNLITMDWRDQANQQVFSFSGTNASEITSLGFRVGMLQDATGRLKVGEVTVHHLSFQTIPEGNSVALWGIGSGLLLALAGRKRLAMK